VKFLPRAALALFVLLPACEEGSPPEPTAPAPVGSAPAGTVPVPPAPAVPPLALSCQAEPRGGDTPLTVRFTAFPSGGTGTYDYRWEFGDGAAAFARRPAHTYTTPGVYAARLTLSSGEQVRHCERSIAVTGLALPPAATPAPGTTGPPDLVITIVGVADARSYSPNPAVARVGQRVLWQNADVMAHTATANGGAFNTGILAAGGASAPVTMGAAGNFPYFCGLHPGMTGTLVVTP
jgi:plastocyanin